MAETPHHAAPLVPQPHGGALRPFQKGAPAVNPGGKLKQIQEALNAMEGYLPAVVKELRRLALESDSDKVRLAACTELLNRVIGKPKESVAVSLDSGEALTKALLGLTALPGDGAKVVVDGTLNQTALQESNTDAGAVLADVVDENVGK